MRSEFLRRVRASGVNCLSHYVPLHNSPAGLRYGRCGGGLSVTEDVAARLARLPLHPAMDENDVDYVVDAVLDALFCSEAKQYPKRSTVLDQDTPATRRSTNHA
jgi:dTDP-4-amino-4,6-dideoxygalactose transaminase